MVKAEPRYTKSNRIKPLTVLTPYYDNESMTSWMIRASLNQGCDPLTFTHYYWPKHRLWTWDLDRGFAHVEMDILHDISILARRSKKELEYLNLVFFAETLGVNPKNYTSRMRWTQPLAKRNRTSLIGYPYCPICLIEGNQAYLKLAWRYTWMMYCSQHCLPLQSHCIYCQHPYQPQLLKAPARYLNQCHYCEKKLGILIRSVPILPSAYAFQQLAEQVLQQNCGYALGRQYSASEWFELVLFYTRLLRRGIKQPAYMFGKLLAYLGLDLDKELLNIAQTALPLDLLTIDERIRIFGLVYHLLNTTLEKWLNACQFYKVSQNSFKWSKQLQMPIAFMPVFQQLSQRGQTSRLAKVQCINPTSPEAVKQSWARLQRKIQMREFYEQNLISK